MSAEKPIGGRARPAEKPIEGGAMRWLVGRALAGAGRQDRRAKPAAKSIGGAARRKCAGRAADKIRANVDRVLYRAEVCGRALAGAGRQGSLPEAGAGVQNRRRDPAESAVSVFCCGRMPPRMPLGRYFE